MATVPNKKPSTKIAARRSSPFLRRVRIRGNKSIAFCDVRLQPLTILVGRNAAGKSNFLEALAFLGNALQLNISEAVNRHGGFRPSSAVRSSRLLSPSRSKRPFQTRLLPTSRTMA